MLILIIFAFLSGIVTVLSPCILPVLPIVLSGSLTGGKRRPYGILAGFILSFTFFTLALTTIVKATGLPPDFLRSVAEVAIFGFGLSLLIPQTQLLIEKFVNRFSQSTPNLATKNGFVGGFTIGLSLGLLWAPCVGPILASVITLALTSSVNTAAIFITLAYAVGTAIPMLAIIQGGRQLLQKVPWLLSHTPQIQKGFGVIMMLIAVALYFNIDRQFQTKILQAFPEYGAGLTSIENNNVVQNQLSKLSSNLSQPARPAGLSDSGPVAPDFIGGQNWFNTPPLTMAQLKGKVVLVDFWTYSCINCIRTLPYLKQWYSMYQDQGFVIVGVHSPEFEFEKDATNVGKAIKDFGITYPVVQDNDLKIWNAYNNEYWPAHYLIDANGKIRYTHFGEGEYDTTEAAIRALLTEAGKTPTATASGLTDQTPSQRISPESYLGMNRLDRIVSSPEPHVGSENYTSPASLDVNEISYQGVWDIEPEFAAPNQGSALNFNFQAQNVYLVMTPQTKNAQVKVWLDDQPISASQAGSDVKDSIVTLDASRLYTLVHLPAVGHHLLRLEFLTPGVQVFAFTFG